MVFPTSVEILCCFTAELYRICTVGSSKWAS